MRVVTCGLGLVGLAFVVARAGADGCTPDQIEDGGSVQHGCNVSGVVSATDGRTLRIGDAVVVIPESRDEVRWCGAPEFSDLYFRRVRVGDAAYAAGTLRRDGTILAVEVYPDDYVQPGRGCASGVIESTGGALLDWDAGMPATFTVGGATYETSILMDAYNFRDGLYSPSPYLAPGDAVALDFKQDGDGPRVVTQITAHLSGEGTRVAGTVTATDEDASLLWVDGVPCVVDEYTHAVYPPAPEEGWDSVWQAMPNGRSVSVEGVLRDGRVLCDRLEIGTAAISAAKAASRRRPGRLSANGAIESFGDRSVVVSGLTLEGVQVRGLRGAAIGRRVHVDARIVDGVVRRVRVRVR